MIPLRDDTRRTGTPVVNVLYHRSNGQRGDPNGALHERVATIGVGLTFQPGR